MKNKIQITVMCAVATVFLACASASFGQIKVGGFKAAPTDDAGVVAAAEFGVSNYSENNEVSLIIVNILKAERQVVQGMNYRLCVEVGLADEGNDQTQFVLMHVSQDLKRNFRLNKWKPDACGGEE